MNRQEKQFRGDILKQYVKRQSVCELAFIDEQKRSGLKVCDRISHQRSRDGRDELVIETQLSSSNNVSESSVNQVCTPIKSNNCSNKSPSSLDNNDRSFIKQVTITHGKSRSLDSEQINRIQEMCLTTVVGTTDRPFETVYKAVVEHTDNGHHLLQQDSFVRDATLIPSSYNSLPTRTINSLSLLSTAGSKCTVSNRKKSKKSWRTIFPLHKKKGSNNQTDQIEELAKQRFKEMTVEKVGVKQLNASLPDGDVPFKSYKIGEPLQKMKKKKSIPSFIRNMLSPRSSLSKSGIWSCKDNCDGNNNTETKLPDTESSRKGQQNRPVTRIVTTLSRDREQEDFIYSTNDTTWTNEAVQGTELRRSDDEQLSNFHFDMTLSDSRRTRAQSGPDKPCDCYTRRVDLMVRGINIIIVKGKATDLLEEMEQYDRETCHFKNCALHDADSDVIVSCGRKHSHSGSSGQSKMSLYQQCCEYCANADEQLHPEISVHLLPLINKLENGNEINFNNDHLQFFLSAKCYKEFEEGMGQAIGFKCSIRNLAHLHYVTRKIVRHIGDPNKEDNEHIRQIMYFAERFCADHYYDHIEKHGSLEQFLKHCTHDDID